MRASTNDRREPLLTDEEFAELAKEGHEVSYPAKTVLIRQGELSDFVLYLQEGHVKAVRPATNAIVEIHGPRSLVGEIASLTGFPRSADVVAMTDVRGLLVPGKVWRAFLQSHQRAALAHYSNLARRYLDSDSARGESFASSEHRVATALLRLVDSKIGARTADGIVFHGISQRDVAALAKVSRESVAAVLRQLRTDGAVSTSRERFTVHDLEAIERLAQRHGPSYSEGME